MGIGEIIVVTVLVAVIIGVFIIAGAVVNAAISNKE